MYFLIFKLFYCMDSSKCNWACIHVLKVQYFEDLFISISRFIYCIYNYVFIRVKSPEHENCCLFFSVEFAFYIYVESGSSFTGARFNGSPEWTNKTLAVMSVLVVILLIHKCHTIKCVYNDTLNNEGSQCLSWCKKRRIE